MKKIQIEEPIGLISRLRSIALGLTAGVAFPYMCFTWLCHDFVPFFPGTRTAIAQVTEKYAIQKHGRRTEQRTKTKKETTHIRYEFPVDDQPILSHSLVSSDFFDSLRIGESIEIYYVPWAPSFSRPVKDPPRLFEWFGFGLAFLLMLILTPLGWLGIYFGLTHKNR